MPLTLSDYQAMPYTIIAEAIYEDDGPPYWAAWVGELTGCYANGKTNLDAINNLQLAFDDYIKTMLKLGREIPTPHKMLPKTYPEISIDTLDDEIRTPSENRPSVSLSQLIEEVGQNRTFVDRDESKWDSVKTRFGDFSLIDV